MLNKILLLSQFRISFFYFLLIDNVFYFKEAKTWKISICCGSKPNKIINNSMVLKFATKLKIVGIFGDCLAYRLVWVCFLIQLSEVFPGITKYLARSGWLLASRNLPDFRLKVSKIGRVWELLHQLPSPKLMMNFVPLTIKWTISAGRRRRLGEI